MDENQQLSARLGAFLNSSDLTDSPVARTLYDSYVSMNNSAAKRLIDCEVLLQKKQKIEAVISAQQTPNLFDVLELVFFPGRNVLLHLAELYDWLPPDSIDQEAVVRLRKAFNEMDDLRPLLTEYRRIARTDQVKNKLMLLRDIAKLDKDNPEWKEYLYDVESQYLSKLIEEAKNCIINKDFDRLEVIYSELTGSQWVASVPTIVLQKVERIVAGNRQDKIKKEAVRLLDAVNSAYACFDIIALEDAMFCWQSHCSETGYVPDDNEKRQFEEAANYLSKEKETRQKQQLFQSDVEYIMALVDKSAPLDQVEKLFSKLLSSGFEVPLYVSNRVRQYRVDIERERRAATVIKSCKIIGAIAVIMLVLIGSGVMIVQFVIENKQAAILHQAIADGDIVRAKTILEDISKTYPDLVDKPKITKEKAALQALCEREKAREDELQKIFASLDALKKIWPLSDDFKAQLSIAGNMVKSTAEKSRLREFKIWYEDAYTRMTHEAEQLFYKQLSVLRSRRDIVLNMIENEEFTKAETIIIQMENLISEIKKIKYLDEGLLEDNKDLLTSGDTVRRMFEQQVAKKQRTERAVRAISDASDLNSLESAVKLFRELSSGKGSDADTAKVIADDLEALKVLMLYQSGAISLDSAAKSNVAFFNDVRKAKSLQNAQVNAVAQLRRSFDSLQKNVNKTRYCFIRFKTDSGFVDIYFNNQGISRINNELRIQRDDGALVKIIGRYNGRWDVVSGDETYNNCQLVTPREIGDNSSLRKSVAPHQKLIEKLFFYPAIRPEAVFDFGSNCLQQIIKDPYCAPFWKLQLSLTILNAVAPLDISSTGHFNKLKAELEKIKMLDNKADNPLYNKFLNEKLSQFFSYYRPEQLVLSAKENKHLYNFFIRYGNLRFAYLGLQLNVGKNTQVTVNPAFKDKVADVYCFVDDRRNCMRVGKMDKGTLLLDDDFKEMANGRLLFTTEPAVAVSDFQKELRKNENEVDIQKIKWPEFWPNNLRGF